MAETRYGALQVLAGSEIGLAESADSPRLPIRARLRKGLSLGTHVVVTIQDGAVVAVVAGEPPREVLAVPENPTPATAPAGQFFNPYTFVPLGTRDTDQDGAPPRHDEYALGRYSGLLDVVVTATTPLLVLDQAGAEWTDDHATLRTLTTPDGDPYLPGSALKGMLRSAFETVTGSRMGVFDGQERIFVRDNVDDARNKLPAVVVKGATGALALHVVTGIEGSGIAAVMVPRRILGRVRDRDEVLVEAVLVSHERPPFKVWRATKVMTPDGEATLGQSRGPQAGGHDGKFTPADDPPRFATFRGFLHVTGRTAKNKHDERLVVTEALGDTTAKVNVQNFPLTDDMIDDWRATLKSYLKLRAPGGIELPDGVHSGPYGVDPSGGGAIDESWELTEGRTLFVELSEAGAQTPLRMLSPAMVGRRLMPWLPRDLVSATHVPPQGLNQLSPADRVFGWVKGKADDHDRGIAYRGNLRIEPARLTPSRESGKHQPGVERFDSPLTLGILSSPKSQQVRFYFGGPNSLPLGEGVTKNHLADKVGTVRGTKVFPPQRDFDLSRAAHPGQNDASNQDRSIADCIPTGAEFTTRLQFANLNRLELGALLYLLTLPEGYDHRLGMGKPLGFGSVHVRLATETSLIWDQESRRGGYRSLAPLADSALPTVEAVADVVADFLAATRGDGNRESSRQTWEKLSAGYSGPVHYPRTQPPGPPEDGYTWFVTNEHDTKDRLGRKVSLPAPGGTLPYDTSKAKPSRQGQAEGRGGHRPVRRR